MTKLINLTPHAVTIRVDEADIILQPTLPSARVGQKSYRVASVHTTYSNPAVWPDTDIEIPVHVPLFTAVENLPEPQDGVIYITSMMVANSPEGKEREDVYALDTGPTAIRDADGNIKAVRGLVKY